MSQPQLNPRQALIVIRIIWAALLMGVLVFAAVVLFVVPPPASAPDPLIARTLLYVAVAMLCVLVPVGWLIRGFIWRAGRTEDGTVSVGAYNTGNIIQLAMCEGSRSCRWSARCST